MIQRRIGLLPLLGTVAVVLALAVPALAEEPEATPAPAAESTAPQEGAALQDSAALQERAKDLRVTLGGMNIAIDPDTGDLQPLTASQASHLRNELRKMFPSRTPELVTHADGSWSTVVVPNVLRYSVARILSDGTVEADCVAGQEKAIERLTAEPTVSQKTEEE